MVQELAHYQAILTDRSELAKLQIELVCAKDNAEATRQYHLISVNHLEEKLKVDPFPSPLQSYLQHAKQGQPIPLCYYLVSFVAGLTGYFFGQQLKF